MRRIGILAVGLVAVCGWAASACASLVSACRAREMLGPETWSRVLRIDNADPRGPYPRTVYATVFAFDGILWFYTDANGTQSLSLYRGRLAQDEAGLGPLLRAIDPGFHAFREVTAEGPAPADRDPEAPLANGCFIESLAAARRRFARGAPILRASLLLYYADCGGRLLGHCVFVYETPRGVFLTDPDNPGASGRLGGRTLPESPLNLAESLPENLTWMSLVQARYVPVAVPSPAASVVAVRLSAAAVLSRAGSAPALRGSG